MTPWSAGSARRAIELVRALWFVPSLMASAGVVLGVVMPGVDAIPDVLASIRLGWLRHVLDSAPAGAQQLLATSAGALATILGVAFSLTLVTLQLAAAQYTPRLVGRLLEDRVTKIVLGSYLGTIAYLLLVLRSVHGVGEGQDPFVPRLSILLALLLILGCLGLLAYFVHHLGESIQPASLGARIVAQTLDAVDRLSADEGIPVARAPDGGGDPPALLRSGRHGYVQEVDLERLREALPGGTALARVEVAAGDYVLEHMPLVSLWPERALTDEQRSSLLSAFALGPGRTLDRDVLYGVRLLADVGLKALSPGVNDETTAVTAVNHLGVVVGAAARRGLGACRWASWERDGLALITPALPLRRLVEDAFAGLVRFAADHPRVLARIAEVLAEIAAKGTRSDGHEAVLAVAEWIEHAAARGGLAPHERRLVASRVAALRAPRERSSAERPHAMH